MWRRNGTLYLLKPLRCLFKLHVFCDLPLKKDLAFKHLRTCIYLKWAPDKSPVILGIFAYGIHLWFLLIPVFEVASMTFLWFYILLKILYFLKRQILVRFIPNWIVSILDIFACISKLFLNLCHSKCILFIVTWCH